MTEPAATGASASGGIRSDQVSGAVLLALGAYIGWLNRAFPVGTLADPGPGYVPLLLACGLGAMGLLIAIFGSRSETLASLRWPELTRAVVILVACAVATLALERIGYRLTTAAMLVFFIGIVERKHWLTVILVSAGFSIASQYIVGDLLKVPLPRGPWGF